MLRNIVAAGAAVIVLIAAVVAYYVFRPPAEASGPIQAIPIATEAPAPQAAASTAPPVAQVAATSAPAATAAPEATAEPDAPATTTGATVFEIVPAASTARFLIDEVLRGSPVTVVGATDQVAGQIALDPANLAATNIGVIQVNARALATDNEFRNRAIKNAILRTNEHEFITFTPGEIVGLPAAGAVGQRYSFQVTGDLTVKGVTRTVTFDVTVTPVSATRIEGVATATVLYRDFELAIPDSPAVDTVADEVRLELTFVAEA